MLGFVDSAENRIAGNADRKAAIELALQAARKRLKGIVGGDLDAITGGKGTAGGGAAGGLVPDTDDAEEATKAETKALDKLKDMEEDLAKQRRTNLENEIAAIQKLRDEYTKNIDLLIQQKKIAFEAAKEGGEVERAIELSADIARYNRQKNAAMAGYDQMEADARKKDAARREKERRDYERFMDDMAKDAQERALGRELDAMNRDKDYSGLQAYLNILIDSQSKALNAAVTQYNDQLTAFLDKNSEGGEEIVEAEKDVLRDIQDAINEANGRIIDYTERLERAQQAADDAAKMPEAHVVGAWSLAALEQLFDASAMDRTAHATEKMVSQQDKQLANQDKMNRTLTQIKDESQLVYGD
jgi:hypothetical protein